MTLPQIDTYTIITGTLPPGLTLNQPTGLISGTVPDTSTPPPTWVTPSGVLIISVEGVFVTVTLVATPAIGHTIDHYSVIEYETVFVLPWGLTLNPLTGVLSGTIAEIPYIESAYTYPVSQRPTWNPPLGVLISTVYEFDVYSVFLSADAHLGTHIVDYTVVDGFLPWGLTITRSTGRIYGTVAQLKSRTPASYVPKTPVPAWTTASGTLGTFAEEQTLDLTLLANPLLGTIISTYSIINGFLPWGLTLNTLTGHIVGTTAVLKIRGTPSLPSPPVWSLSTLGTRTIGSTISITLTASAVIGTLAYFQVVRGHLPWGLTISTNKIIGTISADTNVAGSYTVIIKAVDTRGASTNRTLTMTLI